jgi:hypothetical protein
MNRFSDSLHSQPSIKSADSLASAGNGWMRGIWPDEVGLETIVFGQNTPAVNELADSFRLHYRAKAILRRLLGRDT